MYKVLVPVDFSDTSLNALRYAVRMFKPHPLKITVLHTYGTPSSAFHMKSLDRVLAEDADRELDRFIKKVEGEGVTEENWRRMVSYAQDKGWSGGNYKNLNLPVDNWLMAQPREVRERMVKRVEEFTYSMLVDVFNASDTAPIAMELLVQAGSHDIGAEAARIENPSDWTKAKIIARAQTLEVDKGPEGDFDD